MPPTSPDDIHFFISYTGKDKAWAEWIAWQLEHKGCRTLLQAWDFKSDGIFPGDMHRALQKIFLGGKVDAERYAADRLLCNAS